FSGMSDEQNERSEPIADKNLDVNESENVVDVAEEEYSLAEIEEMEEQARRLLAGQDSHSCTYAEGYRPRQCVYSCITCVPTGGAGICYGCSLLCHDGHDLVELFTKRRFKCDCGNGAFKDKCKLFEDKAPHNERNTYNHNFVNSYCWCKRPYPDEEAPIQDSQLQCIACEDWFHYSTLEFLRNRRQSTHLMNTYARNAMIDFHSSPRWEEMQWMKRR
uniref:UBR-type domain-containing protein n=1 Tax=Pristionchus pacificus TaxID=54126 RepID=A0A8R1Z316_PRIPA